MSDRERGRSGMSAPAPGALPPPLTTRALNRATLARQMLLARAETPAVSAIERLAGLQAQRSPSPYLALWSRLERFQITDLERALGERTVVKATLMRGTLHLVAAQELPLYVAATRNPAQATWTARARSQGIDTEPLRQAIIQFTTEQPRMREEILTLLNELAPAAQGSPWERWRIVGEYGDLLHVPPGGLWRSHSAPRYAPARHWLPDTLEAEPGAAYVHLVRRYLGAFGPASRADIASWSGQPLLRLAPALTTLAPELCTFRDERGRVLYDLVDSPRPAPDVPAPARFLPKWDNLLLAYQDRTRVLPAAHRKTVIRINGDVLPTFLLDGVVAGAWEVGRRRAEATLRLSPFLSLQAADQRALTEEGERLLRFIEPDAVTYAVSIEGVVASAAR